MAWTQQSAAGCWGNSKMSVALRAVNVCWVSASNVLGWILPIGSFEHRVGEVGIFGQD